MTDIVGVDTLLEGDLPEKAFNYGSLAAFAAKTETDWTDELTNAETNRWGDNGLLGGLFEGLEQGKPFIAALIQAIIHKSFEDVSDVFANVDDAFDGMLSNFSGKWRDILSAQNSADYANAQLAAMDRSISELFDGAEGDLPGSWSVSYSGSGGGEIQQDGRGNAWWDGFGGITRTGKAMWNAGVLGTDKHVISTVMPLRVQDPSLGGESWLRLVGRSDTTGDNYVYCEIGNDSVTVGYVVSGSATPLSTVSTATASGDSYDFYIGSATSDYQYVVKRNGVVLMNPTESGTYSFKGSAYRSVGFIMRANDRNLFLSQTSPGKLAVFSADDQ